MKKSENLEEMKKLAFDAAIQAGKILVGFFGKEISPSEKSRGDYVTKADFAADRHITSRIRKKFPSARIVSEEQETKYDPAFSGYTWLIDPLDGTGNFTFGIPNFFVIIGIAKQNQVVFCLASQPLTKQLYWAEKGKGAFLGKKRIHCSTRSDIKGAKISIGIMRESKTSHATAALYSHAFFDFKNVLRPACVAYTMTAVASGKLDGHFLNIYLVHDCGALTLLITEAGGKISKLNGGPLPLDSEEDVFNVMSNSKIHKSMLKYARKFIKPKKT